jgi:hypothetical protein
MGSRTLKILQLNVRKRREVQQSLLNDEELKDYAVLAVSEPYARLIEGVGSPTATYPRCHRVQGLRMERVYAEGQAVCPLKLLMILIVRSTFLWASPKP